MNNINKQDIEFEQWYENLKALSFEERAFAIKEEIIKKSNFDKDSIKFFNDCFEYFMKQYHINKPIDLELFKIFLVKIKGWDEDRLSNISDIFRIFVLLTFCGFNLKEISPLKNLNKNK